MMEKENHLENGKNTHIKVKEIKSETFKVDSYLIKHITIRFHKHNTRY